MKMSFLKINQFGMNALYQCLFICFLLFSNSVFALTKDTQLKVSDDLQVAYLSEMGVRDSGIFFNPLYQRILDALEGQYERIGHREAQRAIDQRDGFFVGGMNQIGFRWSRDFVDFSFEVHRQLAPDLFDDSRWIVSDELKITIEATKLLSNLRDINLIDLTDKQLHAFAGLKFERRYRHSHFANSYEEGLGIHLDRLFFAFKAFNGKGYLDLAPYEYIEKRDSLSVIAGGLSHIPLAAHSGVGLSATLGALIRYETLSSVDIHSIGPSDQHLPGERLRVSVEKNHIREIGISSSVQVEFLRILRLTLLSFDYDFIRQKSYRSYLRFFENDFSKLFDNSETSQALSDLVNFRKEEIDILSPYRVSQDIRDIEQKKSKYYLFFRGGMRDQKTEQIKISSKDHEKTFFRHNYEQTKYRESILSSLFSSLIRSIFRIDPRVQDEKRDSKSLRLEYQSERNLVQTREDLHFKREEDNFSIRFGINYSVSEMNRGLRKSQRQRIIGILGRQTGADPLAEKLFENNYLTGPVNLNARFEVGRDGVFYFNHLSPQRKYLLIDEMCGYQPRNIFSFFRNLFNFCRHRLKRSYELYEIELNHQAITSNDYLFCKDYVAQHTRSFWRRTNVMKQCLLSRAKKSPEQKLSEIPLWRLKDFLQLMHTESQDKVDYYFFFGLENIFHYGDLRARSYLGAPFQTHFAEGRFHGLGVVENYKFRQGLRTPASIELD